VARSELSSEGTGNTDEEEGTNGDAAKAGVDEESAERLYTCDDVM
jgi:hypothetical protein